MKLVYDCEQSISLGPKREFESTSIWWHLHLLDAEQALNCTNRIYYKTFEEFFEACAEGYVRNADAYIGLFKTPKVSVKCGMNHYTVTKRNFQEVCVWNHANEVSHLPMSTLMDKLPAGEFAEYLRERGIALCQS
jgi:hypothetical protein